MKRLPGYTAQALLAEDAELVEDFIAYMGAEAHASKTK